jgi:hypothetical protein
MNSTCQSPTVIKRQLAYSLSRWVAGWEIGCWKLIGVEALIPKPMIRKVNMHTLIINETKAPKKIQCIGYIVTESFEKRARNGLVLKAVNVKTYPHPQAPDNAIIDMIETDLIQDLGSDEKGYAALLLLKHALKNVDEIVKANNW